MLASCCTVSDLLGLRLLLPLPLLLLLLCRGWLVPMREGSRANCAFCGDRRGLSVVMRPCESTIQMRSLAAASDSPCCCRARTSSWATPRLACSQHHSAGAQTPLRQWQAVCFPHVVQCSLSHTCSAMSIQACTSSSLGLYPLPHAGDGYLLCMQQLHLRAAGTLLPRCDPTLTAKVSSTPLQLPGCCPCSCLAAAKHPPDQPQRSKRSVTAGAGHQAAWLHPTEQPATQQLCTGCHR